MKNYLSSIFAILILTSCNSDDDRATVPVVPTPPSSSLVATIDGTEYTFSNFSVEEETFTEPGYTYVDIHVTATMPNDPTKKIEFNVEQGELGLGTESVYFFAFHNGDLFYDNSHPLTRTFTVNVTENTTTKIKGTFAGVLSDGDDIQTATIASGTFDITY